jgi:hemolysin activation/secretion protein
MHFSKTGAILLGLLTLVMLAPHSCPAQAAAPSNQPAGPSTPQAGADATAAPALPPLPPPATGAQAPLSEVNSVVVKGFRFRGNTAISDRDLDAVARAVLDQRKDHRLTVEDLESIRNALTLRYVNAGFINSGAVLPDQTIGDGIVTFQIIEGRLSAIDVERRNAGTTPTSGSATEIAAADRSADSNAAGAGSPDTRGPLAPPALHPNESTPPAPSPTPATQPATTAPATPLHLLRDRYLTDRIYLSAGPPLNIAALKDRMEILRQNDNIESLNGILKPGNAPGESDLTLFITEKNPIHVGTEFSNSRSPSVGAYRIDLLASDTNLTGNSDALGIRYGLFEGDINTLRFSQANDYQVSYELPITKFDTALDLSYTRSSDLVVEAPFAEADISSVTDDIEAAVRQPIYHTPTTELALFSGISSKYNRTFVMGQPISFSPGADDGKSDVFAIRFGQELTTRRPEDAIALRSTFSVGAGVAGATINHNGQPDSRFFSWLGQFQYVHRLPLGPPDSPLSDSTIVARLNGQLAGQSLLALEQFSLGGVETVRGYRENEVVRDDGANGQVELHLPLVAHGGREWLALVPFVDTGYGWDVHGIGPPEFLSSAGMGIVLTPTDQIDTRLYYGRAFQHFSEPSYDVQDSGIHFSLTWFLQ